ncbi:MAG: hypothetical protein KDH95_24075, partial [Calditrichaeota bacterium]|nr:hypothetical protein [Calditrichota bacterium]
MNKQIKLHMIKLLISCIILILSASVAVGQTRTHNLGDYKYRVEAGETINTNDVEPTGEWPQDQFRYGTVVFRNSGFAILNWVDENGTT